MAPVGQYLRYSTVFDEQANLRVLALAATLDASRPAGVREIYPGYGSVYVEWDDSVLPDAKATAWIAVRSWGKSRRVRTASAGMSSAKTSAKGTATSRTPRRARYCWTARNGLRSGAVVVGGMARRA